ncbi:hypothetical protein F4780DRAFT_335385 [Xylariomycetidae sp. FL0641]|nr:hypothetical protein F4780DRAFT_335385 [Xylariomycetidae sp. FL0641]
MSRSRLAEKRNSVATLSSLSGPDTVKVTVGPARTEFFIPRKLLASCYWFREQIDEARLEFHKGRAHIVVRLDSQCPDMFKLFTFWLYEQRGFDRFLDDAEGDRRSCEELHWDLVNLHLFAAQVDLPQLQDLAMDGLQDLYLRCNWDINAKLVKYIYTECDPRESCRLRKWIVAMTAWTLGDIDADDMADTVRGLFEECYGLREQYYGHLRKMTKNRLEVHSKNPQLRLPSNQISNQERQFGFRQCSFHTHRIAIGQGKCPITSAFSPTIPSPATDGYVESDSERSETKFGSRMVSPCSDTMHRMVSPCSDTIHESDMEF